jgi:hypothetical protein
MERGSAACFHLGYVVSVLLKTFWPASWRREDLPAHRGTFFHLFCDVPHVVCAGLWQRGVCVHSAAAGNCVNFATVVSRNGALRFMVELEMARELDW